MSQHNSLGSGGAVVLDRGDTRPAVPYRADERAMLEAWLEYHRATLLWKCQGLDGEQLARRACPPSSLSLLGLVRHMAEVERWWFLRGWRPEPLTPLYWSREFPDGDFDLVDPARAADDVAAFEQAVAAGRAEAARHDLDETVRHDRGEEGPQDLSLRWMYVHMIEEYARHNGHADLLRELIDGAVGD